MPTPHAEEVLSVHLRVPSPAPGGCVALAHRRVCVCVCVHSFLPPRASRPRNIVMYVFTTTRKTLSYIIIVIFAE